MQTQGGAEVFCYVGFLNLKLTTGVAPWQGYPWVASERSNFMSVARYVAATSGHRAASVVDRLLP